MSTKLKSKQVQAAALLAAGVSATDAAKRLGVRKETLSRWQKIPEFNIVIQQDISEARAEMQKRLHKIFASSLDTIQQGIEDASISPNCVKAAFSALKLFGIEQILAPTAPNPPETVIKASCDSPPVPPYTDVER